MCVLKILQRATSLTPVLQLTTQPQRLAESAKASKARISYFEEASLEIDAARTDATASPRHPGLVGVCINNQVKYMAMERAIKYLKSPQTDLTDVDSVIDVGELDVTRDIDLIAGKPC